ncbi:MAG TPA: T9SS type A sorting domain-containing protein [Draconibacterium sp.]|nr:T9SS type A sorting domain-containing protein [Draconibacterium sp.]
MGITSLESSVKAEASSECLDQFGNVTAIDEAEANNNFTIFPIPVKERLVLECSEYITSINIYQVGGALVKSLLNIESHYVEIPCNDMDSGFYIVRSTAGKKNYVRKFNVVK